MTKEGQMMTNGNPTLYRSAKRFVIKQTRRCEQQTELLIDAPVKTLIPKLNFHLELVQVAVCFAILLLLHESRNKQTTNEKNKKTFFHPIFQFPSSIEDKQKQEKKEANELNGATEFRSCLEGT